MSAIDRGPVPPWPVRLLHRLGALAGGGVLATAALAIAGAMTIYFHCGCSILWPAEETWPARAEVAAPWEPPRLALVLGGGGTRGFAHVGVIKALEAAGIEPDLVVRTNVGSLIGAPYAAERGARELERIARDLGDDTLCGWTWPCIGLHTREPLRRFVAVATDLASSEPAAFGAGEAGRAVQASASVPGHFVPVEIADRAYVDGGLVAPVAVAVARRLRARTVVDVDVSHRPGQRDRDDFVEVLSQAFIASAHAQGRRALADEDVVVRQELAPRDSTGTPETVIAAGERAARDALPRLRALRLVPAATKLVVARR